MCVVNRGEFWISDGKQGVVTAIPWWSPYADPVQEGDSWPGRSEARQKEAEILAAIKARIAEIEESVAAKEETPDRGM